MEAETTVSITVTSEDASRRTTYQVGVSKPPCLDEVSDERLSEVTFVGGSISELEACARRQDIAALYYWTGRTWLLFAPEAPGFLSGQFRQHFANGVAPGSAFVAATGSNTQHDK